MERGRVLIVLLLFRLGPGGIQYGSSSSQISSIPEARLASLWLNETCEDICACLEAIMKGVRATQICMEVKGYPCHLARQLMRAPLPRNCSVTIGGNWFECDKGTTDCVGGEMSVQETEEMNCTGENNSTGSATNTAYLGCETTVGVNTSLTCVLSRDRAAVGQCVQSAECLYRKVNKTEIIIDERVSCQDKWVPFKRHCLSPINGIHQTDILDQKTWNGAKKYCSRRWDSSLLTMTSFAANVIRDLQEKRIFQTDQEVWLGLLRDTDNSSFRWVDDTPIIGDQARWPWAVGHPKPALNYVYMLNAALYSADSNNVHRYSCKMKVSKSLKCRQPQPTNIPQTTEMNMHATTNAPTTQWTKKPKEPIEALHEELTQIRNEVSNYLKTFTSDTAVLDAIDSLITSSSLTNTSDKSNKETSTSIVNSLDSVVEGLSESIVGPAKPLVVSTPEFVLKVLTLCVDCDYGESLGGQLGNQTFSITLPDSIKAAGATLAMSTASLLHEELPATIEGSADGDAASSRIGSLVTTISLRRWDGQSIILTDEEPLKLTFSSLEDFPDFKPSCRYWKVSEGNKLGVWSSDGCRVAKANTTHTTCHITHLTSFAVIMQISRVEEPMPVSLDYLSWVGCALSITCLAITLIIFLSQRMYRADRNIIHMNLALSLMLAQIIFVVGIDRTENEGLCKGVGICVHFFLLATFFWMLNEGIFLLSKTTSAKTRWLRLPTYFTLGWGFPLVIVGVTMATSFDSYDTKERCWLTVDNGGIWAFVGPAAAVILINICILANVIRVFLSLKANMNKKKVERIRIALRAILLTLPLLGCTWLIGMLSFNSGTQVFAYIFVILNSLQGVFIFILYCLLNDEFMNLLFDQLVVLISIPYAPYADLKIKKGLRKRLALLQSLSGRTTHTRASRTATSGSNNHHKTNRLSKTMTPDQEAAKL